MLSAVYARGVIAASFVVSLGAIAGCYQAPGLPTECSITCTGECPGDLRCENGFCVTGDEVCAPAFQRVSAGAGYACALDDAGRLWCWGDNAHHQIDDSERLTIERPARIGTGRWDAIATGGHTCGIADGQLACWGRNDRGQISGAIEGDVTQPTEISVAGGPARWTAVTAGHNSTCAIGDGRLYCWGAGDSGLLGSGATADVGEPAPVATSLDDWTAVAIGWGHDGSRNGVGHACAISASAGLWCWGSNSYGELGDGTATPSLVPVQIALPAPPTSVAAGAYSTCATTAGGELYCWGYAASGALGDPAVIPLSSGNRTTPSLASGLPGWTRVASGEQWTCGLRGNEVWCWGLSAASGLGNGIWRRGSGWGRVTGDATDLSVGVSTNVDDTGANAADLDLACSVAGGEVRCWGDNRYGQLGQGAASQSARPVEIIGEHTWSALAAGASHVCGIEANHVLCWGSTTRGQANGIPSGTGNAPCGAFDGQACDVLEPAALPSVKKARQLALGSAHTCALDDALTCWGDDSANQLGGPGLPPAPTEVPGAWKSLLAPRASAQCAIQMNQTFCWGSIGAITMTPQMPTRVTALDGVTALGASYLIGSGNNGHACYLSPARELYCFGDNTQGQFGNGSSATGLACSNMKCDAGETSVTCPADCGAQPMTRLGRTYQAISVSWGSQDDSAFTCGIRDDGKGEIECWGRNRNALISTAIDPGTQQAVKIVYTPAIIAGLSGCTAVAAGDTFACGICSGDVWCWGDHRRGQVGSGPVTALPVTMPRKLDLALADGDTWAELTAGAGFACARTAQGRGYCWGSNIHGALGTGAGAASLPVPVGPPER
jgi:alpha-tubulin suppressor-like RCC1 family protein